MPPQIIRWTPPLRGLDENTALANQPNGTMLDGQNVRNRDPVDDRLRLSQRPGTKKWANEPVEFLNIAVQDIAILLLDVNPVPGEGGDGAGSEPSLSVPSTSNIVVTSNPPPPPPPPTSSAPAPLPSSSSSAYFSGSTSASDCLTCACCAASYGYVATLMGWSGLCGGGMLDCEDYNGEFTLTHDTGCSWIGTFGGQTWTLNYVDPTSSANGRWEFQSSSGACVVARTYIDPLDSICPGRIRFWTDNGSQCNLGELVLTRFDAV